MLGYLGPPPPRAPKCQAVVGVGGCTWASPVHEMTLGWQRDLLLTLCAPGVTGP